LEAQALPQWSNALAGAVGASALQGPWTQGKQEWCGAAPPQDCSSQANHGF